MRKIVAKEQDKKILSSLLKREQAYNEEIEKTVRLIIEDVICRKDQAILEYTEKFDGVSLGSLRVTEQEIEEAMEIVEKEYLETIQMSYENIKEYNEILLESSFIKEIRPGVYLGEKITPIERVGLYVPGGKAGYPSTVLMTAVPGKVAGCQSMCMVTPPNKEGKVDPYILAAAKIAGVDEIYKCGGAQAIAALAYGTESIKPCYKIVGPGNIFVATAKKQVFGKVDIDMIAGPSEIGILADDTSNISYIASDMLGQSEHDERAAAVLITTSKKIFDEIDQKVEAMIETLPRQEIMRKSIADYGIAVLCDSKEECIEWMNQMAPEHLEILFEDPKSYIEKIENAAAIFVGPYTPEPIGDYMAGPNHTLPTGGTAKFSSPLGVYDYVKKTSVVEYTKEAFEKVKDSVQLFAKKEGLFAHANAIGVRDA